MAQNVNTRRFYIDLDHSDDHAVVRRVPVHQAAWDATESASAPVAGKPASPQARIAPRRLGLVLQSMRRRQSHS